MVVSLNGVLVRMSVHQTSETDAKVANWVSVSMIILNSKLVSIDNKFLVFVTETFLAWMMMDTIHTV